MGLFKYTLYRIVALVIVCAAVIGILTATGNLSFGSVDAVTKATGEIVSRDEIDGTFTVLINKDLHTDNEILTEWEKFFRGEPYGFIFEDITCYVSSSDPAGLEMAQGLQSRLPANQMELKVITAPMISDKIRHGVFDVAVFSDAAVDILGITDVLTMQNVDVLHI